MINTVLNCDCMAFMRAQKDCIRMHGKRFEFSEVLAVVDPEYGIKVGGNKSFGTVGGNKITKATTYKIFDDSKPPPPEYFKEIFRISKNQIIWGGNYFIDNLSNTPCFIVWDKDNSGNFADCELAWTSFKTAVRKFKFRWNGLLQQNMKNKEKRIHPTQKPVGLYKWILKNYAKPGQLILDTHVGSGSLRIACHDLGFDFVGCELDPDYWKAQEERYKNHIAQGDIFTGQEIQEAIWGQKTLSE